ncbi:MAG: single-stranded DNA-binding protein, partial [Pseudomonadota bacterium]|nr:single-stranded DNA-binding protein [Pseudomonadota bacterium]
QTPVTSFSLATTEYRSTQDGNKQSITDWHRIVVWGRQAENCSKFLAKGQPVFIEGKLQTRSWEDQNGQKRSTTEVVASNVQFLRSSSPDHTRHSAVSDDNLPSKPPVTAANDEATMGDVPF